MTRKAPTKTIHFLLHHLLLIIYDIALASNTIKDLYTISVIRPQISSIVIAFPVISCLHWLQYSNNSLFPLLHILVSFIACVIPDFFGPFRFQDHVPFLGLGTHQNLISGTTMSEDKGKMPQSPRHVLGDRSNESVTSPSRPQPHMPPQRRPRSSSAPSLGTVTAAQFPPLIPTMPSSSSMAASQSQRQPPFVLSSSPGRPAVVSTYQSSLHLSSLVVQPALASYAFETSNIIRLDNPAQSYQNGIDHKCVPKSIAISAR